MKNLNNYFLKAYVEAEGLNLFNIFLCRIERDQEINQVHLIAFIDECNEELGIEICNRHGFEIDMDEAILTSNFLDTLCETPNRFTSGTYFLKTEDPIGALIDYLPQEDRDSFHSFIFTEDEFMGIYSCLNEGTYIITIDTRI